MNINSNARVLTVSLTIPSCLVDLLRTNASRNFMAEQPGRFLPLGEGALPSPDAPAFRNGTLMWTESAADALLLRACEEAAGEEVTLLSDECGDEFFSGIVVLSSRPYPR
jgi:hypothetical protein